MSAILLAALVLPIIVPASTALAQLNPSNTPTTFDGWQPFTNLFGTGNGAAGTGTTPSFGVSQTTPQTFTPPGTWNPNTTPTDICAASPDSTNGNDIANFIFAAGVTGGSLFILDSITSALAEPPVILGNDVGGVLEPTDEVSDFLFAKWMSFVGFGILASVAVWVTGYMVDAGIALNLSISKNAIIAEGGGIIRALVNIGFVVGLIAMAFATMFRREEWSASKLLPRFIVAAVLVSFSLPIAFTIAGIGTSLTKSILSVNGSTIASSYISTFNVAKVYTNVQCFINAAHNGEISYDQAASTLSQYEKLKPESALSKAGDLFTKYVLNPVENYLTTFAAMIFAVLLSAIGAVTLFVIFIFFIIRYVVLTILIMFAPVAWLGFAFPKLNIPGLGNAWGGWWEKFLKWVFFGPAIAFFLFMAQEIVKQLGTVGASAAGGVGFLTGLMQMFVVTIFSLAGLYVANSVGTVGSEYVMKGATMAAGRAGKFSQTWLRKGQLSAEKAAGKQQSAGNTTRAALFKGAGQLSGNLGKYSSLSSSTPAGQLLSRAGFNIPDHDMSGVKLAPDKNVVMADKLQKGEIKGAEKAITPESKEKLKRATGNDKTFSNLEKLTFSTIESNAETDTDKAAQILNERIASSAKISDFGKDIKLNSTFQDLKRKDFSDDTEFKNAVDKMTQQREKVVKSILISTPDAIAGALKHLSITERNNFGKTTAAVRDQMKSGKSSLKTSDDVENFLKTSAGKKLLSEYVEGV